MKQKLYEGVTYRRVVRVLPRPMIAHVLEIDTKVDGIRFLVTPPDSQGETPLNARTTSQFLDEFDLQIAINGDRFSPWWSRSVATVIVALVFLPLFTLGSVEGRLLQPLGFAYVVALAASLLVALTVTRASVCPASMAITPDR